MTRNSTHPGCRRRGTCNVRVVELRDRSRLPLEAFAQLWIARERRGEHLDCDDAIQAGVAPRGDLAHSARAERGKDLDWSQPRA